jgi:hypothetical protein
MRSCCTNGLVGFVVLRLEAMQSQASSQACVLLLHRSKFWLGSAIIAANVTGAALAPTAAAPGEPRDDQQLDCPTGAAEAAAVGINVAANICAT